MKYKFPHIQHIDDVLPVIQDCEEFIVVEKPGYIVVNYVMMTENTFPAIKTQEDAIKRECRGMTFCSKTGKVLARKFHKFFNVNEKPETHIDEIRHLLDKKHSILDKVDGSMITPIILEEGDDKFVRWTTKMGITDIAMDVEAFVAQHPNYRDMALDLLEDYGDVNTAPRFTPIFEWCSRKNRIVIDYGERDQLILLAIRQIETGQYMPYEEMKEIAEAFNVPVVEQFDSSTQQSPKEIVEFIDNLRGEQDIEGVIIRFDDGHMIKVKTEWYCDLHKIKELISQERNLVKVILDGNIDDVLSFCDPERAAQITNYERALWKQISDVMHDVQSVFDLNYSRTHGSRKKFALEYANDVKPAYKALIFRNWDSLDYFEIDDIVKVIDGHLTRNAKYDIIKEQFNLPDYDDVG